MAQSMRKQTPQPRWLYLVEVQCYAIGYYHRDNWHATVFLCYMSQKLLSKAAEYMESDTRAVQMVFKTDETDYLKVIPGIPVECEVIDPSPGKIRFHASCGIDGDVSLPEHGKITINGQVVYGMARTGGMVWTPVKPNMGAVDIYDMNQNLHEAVGKNLFGEQFTLPFHSEGKAE